MRITNGIIQTSLTHVQNDLRDLCKSQEQVTSGRKFVRAYENPVDTATSTTTRTSIRAIDPYQRGIQQATARAAAEEAVLDQISGILMRAKELGVAFGTDRVSPQQRIVAGLEIEGLMREAVSLANSRYHEGFLFSGTGSHTRPYEVVDNGGVLDFTTTNPSGTRKIEVSGNHYVSVNHSGTEVFEDTGVLATLRDMAAALRTGDHAALVDTMPAVDGAFDRIQHLLGAVGARSNSLQITNATLDALQASVRVLKSDGEDVEIEEAIVDLLSRQTSYQAALMTTSRIIGMSLADYLR